MSGAAPPDRPGLHKGSSLWSLSWQSLLRRQAFCMGCAANLTSKECKGPFSVDAALPVSAEDISLSLAACLCGLRCPLTSEDFEALSLWSLPSLEICIVGAC